MARPVDEALIGRTIAGKFVIESFVGGGAMGAVYKAKQLSLDKAVAIKVLHADLQDPTFVARFQREAKAASKLDHPNSMRVLDYGKDTDGLCYIAMEFLDGQSLFRILRDAHGPLPELRSVDLTRQILAALAAAHDMGIIHRDLKPENIIVVASKGDDGNVTETVKVCDFGMAKMMATETSTDSSIEKLTSRGIVVGTPEYMSPEQGKGEELDARSDLYSVGIILYQMLAGTLPFQADTPIAILLKHMVEVPRAPSVVAPGVHPGLEAICLRVMSKVRDDRFGSAREMRTALRAAIEAEESGADETPLSLPQSSMRQPAARSPFHSVPDEFPAASQDRIVAATGPLSMGTPAAVPRRRAVEMVESIAPKRRRSYAPLLAVSVAVLVGSGVFIARQVRRPSPVLVGTSLPTAPGATTSPAVADVPAEPSTAPSPSTVAAATTAAASSAEARPVGSSASSKTPKPGDNSAQTPAAATSSHGATGATPAPSSAAPSPPAPEAPAPASTPSPAPVAAQPGPFDKASVSFGSVRASQAQAGDVTAAMPSGRFNQCYKDGLRAHGSPVRGAGMLRLVFGSDGHVTEAAFAGPPDLASVGQCVAGAAIGSNVKNVGSGATGAEVDLSFKPD